MNSKGNIIRVQAIYRNELPISNLYIVLLENKVCRFPEFPDNAYRHIVKCGSAKSIMLL